MLVLVSFVLVLAAAVTLVVGLLQSGLTLIYLSIGCSVLAGIVLAVAVLRGRPEPRAAAPVGRPFTPPASAPPVPASVGAPTTDAAPTTSFSAPPPPPAPRPAPVPQASDDAATKAAGTALLGRLRGRRDDAPVAVAPPADAAYAPDDVSGPVTASMPAVDSREDDDAFPIANYDQLRATDLLRQLSPLDRNQLEAVRERETAGKNRFTILSKVDTLLEAQAEPDWDVADDEWDEAEADASTTVIEVGSADDEFADDDFADDEFAAGEMEDDEAEEVDDFAEDEVDVEEVDELVSPVDDFPIAGYESLTVGQILPRLSDLDADQLAEVRSRELQGRARGTILDRIDRLASKSPSAMAMPAATGQVRKAATRRASTRTPATPIPGPAVTAPAPRKARASKAAIPVPPATSTTPMKEAVKRAAATRKAASGAVPARKVAPIPVPAAPVRKAATRRTATPPVVVTPTPRKSGVRKAAAPAVPETTETPMKAAVKKARAAKATKRP